MATKKQKTDQKETALAETGQKKLYHTQKFREDLEKNPPDAFSPEYIKDLFTVSKTGKRRRFDTPEELEAKCVEYFNDKVAEVYDEETGRIRYRWAERPVIGGLAIHLGISRQRLFEYCKRGEYAEILEVAKSLCESYLENALFDNRNPGGLCFTLKNGYGWRDTFELEAVQKSPPMGELVDIAELEAKVVADVIVDD